MPPRQLAALCAVADSLARHGVRWVLAGSAGRALLGCPARPADIDIEVDPDDAQAAETALEVVLARDGGDGRRSHRARAARAGVEVDITSDLIVEGPGGRLAAVFARQWDWSHPVAICGRAIRVAPPEESLCRAIVLGDWDALARLAAQTACADPPVPLRATYVAERLASITARAAR